MDLIIDHTGSIQCLYDEAINLASLGQIHITRASHVEPDEHGMWQADMSPVGGPKLGPFKKRSEALAAEEAWINQHVIGNTSRPESD